MQHGIDLNMSSWDMQCILERCLSISKEDEQKEWCITSHVVSRVSVGAC